MGREESLLRLEWPMKIVGREVVWIHTHFLTDCIYLPAHHARSIEEKMSRVLEAERIVFGIHFDSGSDGGLRIVLECIPLPEPMQRIHSALADAVKPIPSRPRRTTVHVEPPTQRAAAHPR